MEYVELRGRRGEEPFFKFKDGRTENTLKGTFKGFYFNEDREVKYAGGSFIDEAHISILLGDIVLKLKLGKFDTYSALKYLLGAKVGDDIIAKAQNNSSGYREVVFLNEDGKELTWGWKPNKLTPVTINGKKLYDFTPWNDEIKDLQKNFTPAKQTSEIENISDIPF